ncbi:unnamed protein product, partial [Prorocentrum cordatum]
APPGGARAKGQDFPSLGGGAPAARPAPAPKAFQMAAEAFPGLGGSSASSGPAAKWGAQGKGGAAPGRVADGWSEETEPLQAAAAPSAAAAVRSAPRTFDGVGDAAFPGLGPAANSRGGAPEPKWGSRALPPESLRTAEPPRPPEKPAEPEPPKEFQGIEAAAFPDLPMGAPRPKPKSAAAKAGAAAAAKAAAAKAAAQRAAARASSSAAAAPVPTSWDEGDDSPTAGPEPEREKETLVVIHDPLAAVAASEELNAARAANSKKKGQKGNRSNRISLNAWTEGPPR